MGLFGNLFGTRGGGGGLRDTRTEEEKQRELERMMDPLGQKRSLEGPWSQFDPNSSPTFPVPPAVQSAPKRSGGLLGEGGFDKLLRAYALAQGDLGSAAQISSGMNAGKIAAAKRQADREDYVWQQQNKAPSPNDTERDYQFWKEQLSPEDFETWKRNKVDPPQYRQGADGQFYRISPQQPAQAPAPAPWKDNPEEWEMVPGGGDGDVTGNFPSNIPSGNPLDPYRRRRR